MSGDLLPDCEFVTGQCRKFKLWPSRWIP